MALGSACGDVRASRSDSKLWAQGLARFSKFSGACGAQWSWDAVEQLAALGSVLCGLIAWDVELFARRLEFYEAPDVVMWAHLRRLGAIVLLSGALGTTALSLTIALSFWWMLAIAFGFLISFSLLLRRGL
jgi:hypothetical protein